MYSLMRHPGYSVSIDSNEPTVFVPDVAKQHNISSGACGTLT